MKQYHIVSRIAIYMLAVVLISFGLYHFQNARDLIVYIPSLFPAELFGCILLALLSYW
jgi:putative oxidoreductase